MRRASVILVLITAIAGCESPTPMPEIDYGFEKPVVKPRITPTPPVRPTPTIPSAPAPGANAWIPSRPNRAWSAIIIHHSATGEGDAAIIDKWHREKGWDGVGYDFVIGNGTDSGDGEVEPTFRWRGQLTGAHTGGTPGNWANEEAIGICLIGDFDHTAPTSRQLDSLIKLVRFLQQRYHIPRSRIYGHGTTPGGHDTDCPGRRFPMNWLKSNASN